MEMIKARNSYSTKEQEKLAHSFKVLIIDDDVALLDLLREFYTEIGFDCVTCEDAEKGLYQVHLDQSFDLIICDLNLPKKSGLEFIEDLVAQAIDTPVILITAHGTIDDAAMALKRGAYDYISKPLNFTELEVLSQRAIKIRNLEKSYAKLKQRIRQDSETSGIVGSSAKMRDLQFLINKVAQSTSNILITGESGSGKEMVAKAIHQRSKRNEQPFVPINCSAIPRDLLEAELFGYKKGAFTGATEGRKGLFVEASGGTLFLDEIGDMPLDLQAKVLRVIQERKVRPIGESKDQDIDVQIIAATHRDLSAAIKDKEFREDLYFRLCVIPVQVPALRERREDIPLLANHFLQKFSLRNEKLGMQFSKEAVGRLKRMPWPGNVRELENAIERAVVLSSGSVIGEDDILVDSGFKPDEETKHLFDKCLTLRDLEKHYIQFVLEHAEGKKEKAAEILGINRKTLYRKEKEYESD